MRFTHVCPDSRHNLPFSSDDAHFLCLFERLESSSTPHEACHCDFPLFLHACSVILCSYAIGMF
jgi:hypothetical protein